MLKVNRASKRDQNIDPALRPADQPLKTYLRLAPELSHESHKTADIAATLNRQSTRPSNSSLSGVGSRTAGCESGWGRESGLPCSYDRSVRRCLRASLHPWLAGSRLGPMPAPSTTDTAAASNRDIVSSASRSNSRWSRVLIWLTIDPTPSSRDGSSRSRHSLPPRVRHCAPPGEPATCSTILPNLGMKVHRFQGLRPHHDPVAQVMTSVDIAWAHDGSYTTGTTCCNRGALVRASDMEGRASARDRGAGGCREGVGS